MSTSMQRDHEVWRAKGGGGIIACTIFQREDAVSVRTTIADGTLLRSQQAPDIETARTIAAEWLHAIRDLILDEGISTE
jgi:hypothetical protein